MKVSIRFDDSNIEHTRFTIFINGANCGTLTMKTLEACSFHQIIAYGCMPRIDQFVSTGEVHGPTNKEVLKVRQELSVGRNQ